MLEAAPDPLLIHVPAGPGGATSQIDVLNDFTMPIERLEFSFEINTGEPNMQVGAPCATPAAFCGADLVIAPSYSYPVTIICPSLPPGMQITRMLTITGTITGAGMGSNMGMTLLSVTCESTPASSLNATNLVFPTTQNGTPSNGIVKVTSGFPGNTPVVVSTPSNAAFTITTCMTGCSTKLGTPVDVGVRCIPPASGQHVGTIVVSAGGQQSTAQLTCTGTTGATGPDAGNGGGGGNDDIGPDAGNGGGNGNNAQADPASFYACSTTALAGALPIVIAIVIAAIRRRR